MRTVVDKDSFELVANLFLHIAGDGDAAWRRNLLHPRRNIDPFAEDVVAVDDYFADVDADAKQHAAIVG